MENIVQVLGMGWVLIIILCLTWTIATYIIGEFKTPKKNEKLLRNMENLKTKE